MLDFFFLKENKPLLLKINEIKAHSARGLYNKKKKIYVQQMHLDISTRLTSLHRPHHIQTELRIDMSFKATIQLLKHMIVIHDNILFASISSTWNK